MVDFWLRYEMAEWIGSQISLKTYSEQLFPVQILNLKIYLFFIIFSNWFILLEVVVDPEPYPGNTGREASTLDGTPVHLRAPYTHLFLSRDKLV